MKLTTRSLVRIGLFISLFTVGAMIKIPFVLVPLTLQVLFVLLAGFMLDPLESFLAITLYVVLGLIGLPIFAGSSGLQAIFKPSFGYLLGFVVVIPLIGLLKAKMNFWFLSGLALFIIYFLGISYFIILQTSLFGKPIKLDWVLINFCIVFLPGDILKVVLAYWIKLRLRLK